MAAETTSNDQTLADALSGFQKIPGLKRGVQLAEFQEAMEKPAREKYEVGMQQISERKSAEDLADRNAQINKQKDIIRGLETEHQDLLKDPEIAQARELSKGRKAFVPTTENVQDLMGLFALTNILGFAIGKGGQANSQAAISAMNGMLEGHQKGREDLYRREKDIFVENQKALSDKINELLRFAQENAKVRSIAKEKGAAEAQQKYLETGATTIADLDRKFGPAKTIEQLKSFKSASDNMIKQVMKGIDDQYKYDQQYALAMAKLAKKEGEGQENILGKVSKDVLLEQGVPLSTQNPYRGLNDKQKGIVFQQEVKKAEESFKDGLATDKKAQDTITAMDEAARILPNLSTGKLARLPGGESLQTMFSADAARFDSIAKGQARNAYVKGEGALSDTERKMFEKQNISLANPIAANEQIIKAQRAIAEISLQRSEYLQRYFAANHTLAGADEGWNRYMRNNPVFDPTSADKGLPVLNSKRQNYQDFFRSELGGQ